MPGEFVYKPLNLQDLFIVGETIEDKIGEEWEVTCKVIGEKKKRRAQPKPLFRHILVSESTVDNIDSSVLGPI